MNIYSLKQIETPRLIIRPVQLGDEIDLNKAINNSLELLQKWQPWAKDPSIEATRGFIQRGVFAWWSISIVDFPMVVIHKADQKIIGASGYNDRSVIEHGLYEIGYWCDVDYQGQGLVTECANALTRYAFDELKAANVIIQMQTENEKSIAVAEKLGFINTGSKDRDPLDFVSENPEINYVYSTSNTNDLPDLTASWAHTSEENADTLIIAWAKQTLKITDNKAFASSRVVLSTPWSTVLEINTGDSLVYLKQTPTQLALESDIIGILHDKFNIGVPKVIAHNAQLNCFLMQNAGRPLREILKQKFDAELFCKAINNFTAMQLTVSENVNVFLDIGVPDWRLDKLPGLYMQLLAQKDILLSDGLSEKEITELEQLLPKLNGFCQVLSEYGIMPSIVQPDFQDNNTLIADKSNEITIIDLGEIVISHPFFSLVGCLQQAKKHYALTDNDAAYQQLFNACLNKFTIFASKNDLRDAFAIASVVWIVYEALAQYRLRSACDKELFESFQRRGRLSGSLKYFIAACKDATH